MSGKVVQLKKSERVQAKAYREELKTYHERRFLECINTINRTLRKTGDDDAALRHLFLHFAMMLCDGGFDGLLESDKRKAVWSDET